MAKARREALTRRRRACGISQEELAAKLRVDPRTVGRWEAGTAEPTPWLRPRLADALGLTLDQLDRVLLLPSDETASNRTEFTGAARIAELDAQGSVETWTGQDANWLRKALRMDRSEFAEHIGAADGIVELWEEQGVRIQPGAVMQRALNAALNSAEEAGRARFQLSRRNRRTAELSAGADPAGRFLADGHIVIATPVKREQIKSRPVIAVEDVLGSRRLGQAAEEHGLKVSYETIPPDGAFDVDRPNIVAICGPRISAAIGAILATDPALAFVRSEHGHWTLFDKTTGQTHISGIDLDRPEPFDVGYLGRLRRPGGQGTIMILTGIHPQGSLGVIKMICSDLSGLYAAVGDRRFSVLLRSEYDPDTSEPINVERLTPFYQEHMVVD